MSKDVVIGVSGELAQVHGEGQGQFVQKINKGQQLLAFFKLFIYFGFLVFLWTKQMLTSALTNENHISLANRLLLPHPI